MSIETMREIKIREIDAVLAAGENAARDVLMRDKNLCKGPFEKSLMKLFDLADIEMSELETELQKRDKMKLCIDYEATRGEVGDCIAYLSAMAKLLDELIAEEKRG